MTPEEQEESTRRAEESKKLEWAKHKEMLAHTAKKFAHGGVPEHEWCISFDSLKVIDQNRDTIDRIKKWNPEIHRKGVVLFGSVGTGKSTLCKALINRWASPSYHCMFISVTDALKNIRSAFDKKTDTTVEAECKKLIDPKLLVFDDLGVDNASDWSKEQIFSVFEARAHSKKHTWFTTNLDPKTEIPKLYGDRIHDRMLEFCSWVKLEGDSWRKMTYVNEI